MVRPTQVSVSCKPRVQNAAFVTRNSGKKRKKEKEHAGVLKTRNGRRARALHSRERVGGESQNAAAGSGMHAAPTTRTPRAQRPRRCPKALHAIMCTSTHAHIPPQTQTVQPHFQNKPIPLTFNPGPHTFLMFHGRGSVRLSLEKKWWHPCDVRRAPIAFLWREKMVACQEL
jgi:hypothetical protein